MVCQAGRFVNFILKFNRLSMLTKHFYLP
jgi:hypothetical protein